MKKFRILLLSFLIAGGNGEAASLFDEKEKDADAALVLNVEEDRKVDERENLRFVQSRYLYLTEKVIRLEARMDELTRHVTALEQTLRELLERQKTGTGEKTP